MGVLPESAQAVLESDGLAHLVTINPDGSAQVSIVWVGLDGGDIVSAHLLEQQKLRNIRRDPRVSLSVETPESNAMGGSAARTRCRRGSRSSPARISVPTSSFRRCRIRRRASVFA